MPPVGTLSRLSGRNGANMSSSSCGCCWRTPKLGIGTPPGLAPGEQLLKSGGANLWRGPVAVGGRLYLTNRQLIFQPHRINLYRQGCAYLLAEIEAVLIKRTLGFIPNGLQIKLSDARQLRLVVFDRGDWMNQILSARK